MAYNTVAPAAAHTPRTNGAVPDPLATLRFRVEIPGVEIGRFAQCSGLAYEYEVLEYLEGGNNSVIHRLRGRARYPNLVLGRGITSEDALLRWFFSFQAGPQRPTVTVTLIDDSGADRRSFNFASAFPIKWTGPEARAGTADALNETLEIGHMGLIS
ncbi:MAG TPA: phage tail protein [Solirubrobacteraceae bacterium]|jgi:phage tail-like protein|nr:phage tail protein [Solirubrobacteraceae bacterium]